MEIENKQKTRDSFLLVDSTVTLKNNDSLTEKYSKIITFDLESHRLLQKNSVKHHVSDEFLDDDDEKKKRFTSESCNQLTKFIVPLTLTVKTFSGIS